MSNILLCPVCSNPQEKGYINRPAETFMFIPENVKLPFFRTRWAKPKGAIIIQEYRTFETGAFKENVYKYPALICRVCKKITLDI